MDWYKALAKTEPTRAVKSTTRLVAGKGGEAHDMEGIGTTLSSIDHEGMSTDDIENVLEKETHRVVPVIASDQIASLAHFVGPHI